MTADRRPLTAHVGLDKRFSASPMATLDRSGVNASQLRRDRRQALRLQLLRLFARAIGPLIPRTSLPLPSAPAILVIRPDHLGDLLFTTPALAALRRALPGAHITCLVGPWAADIVARNPNVDQVLTLSFPWFDRRPKSSPWGPYRVLVREARRLRASHFDLALILRFDHWWGALLAYLAGVPRRIGYDLPETHSFLTVPVPYAPDRHEVLQNLELVRHIQPALPIAGSETLGLEFSPTPDEEAQVTAWFSARGVAPGDPLVGLVPGSGAPAKLWRPEAFAQVGDELARRHTARVVITGTVTERPLAEEIAGRMTAPALVAAGETTLGQLAALLGRCRVVVGVDSGAMHLAVAQGVPTVHLFGPVDPGRFGPWGSPARQRVVSLEPRLPCMFCNRLDYRPEELPAHPCVRDISVEAVLAAIEAPPGSSHAQR